MRHNRETASDAQKALDMALYTLKRITAGGIHGGSCSYSLTLKHDLL